MTLACLRMSGYYANDCLGGDQEIDNVVYDLLYLGRQQVKYPVMSISLLMSFVFVLFFSTVL